MKQQDQVYSSRIDGIHFQSEEPISIFVREGVIEKIQPFTCDRPDELPVIAPGLVDLQINGFQGFDFNSHPVSPELVQQVTRLLWSEGITSYYPTVITNSDEAILEAVRVIVAACKEDALVGTSAVGIHLEGPFISPHDGARGAHGQSFVKAPDWELFQRWQESAEGTIRIVTLSPEWPNSTEFIEKCVKAGVVVSIGHTSATPEQIRNAVAAGATMSTHLGNGAHTVLPRHPNYIWEQLAQDELWACMIADGFHLPESVLKVIMRTKGNRCLLVSDAVYLSGMAPGHYDTHIGGKVVLQPSGKLTLADHPNILAGSAQMLKWGIEHLVKSKLASLSEAWEMASIRPAMKMNLPAKAGLQPGVPANIAVFRHHQNHIQLLQTYLQGNKVYDLENATE
jgi:N-acetylglucosamine-6-phosphate deacetylase